MKSNLMQTTKQLQRSKQVAALVSEGLGPARIAQRLGVTESTVIEYVHRAVGKGLIRQCDVLFSLDKSMRQYVEVLLKNRPTRQPEELKRLLSPVLDGGCSLAEIELYMTYRQQHVYIGALYEFVVNVERLLHAQIKEVLTRHFGEEDCQWWRQGVPEPVRVDCSERWERDSAPAEHPYCYTFLIDLAQIISKNWNLFTSHLPKEYAANKPLLISELKRLNDIRNRVMHPVRGDPPTEEEYEFVRVMHKRICPKGQQWGFHALQKTLPPHSSKEDAGG